MNVNYELNIYVENLDKLKELSTYILKHEYTKVKENKYYAEFLVSKSHSDKLITKILTRIIVADNESLSKLPKLTKFNHVIIDKDIDKKIVDSYIYPLSKNNMIEITTFEEVEYEEILDEQRNYAKEVFGFESNKVELGIFGRY